LKIKNMGASDNVPSRLQRADSGLIGTSFGQLPISDWILISRMIRQKTIVNPASPSLAFHVNPIKEKDSGIAIRIRALPNAKKTEVIGVTGDRVKIRLHAPPVDGKANKELISFLAKTIGFRKSACTITQGETSRDKTAFVHDVSPQQVKSALGLSV
jgi:uncharacterized protein (TIGR00251 family)